MKNKQLIKSRISKNLLIFFAITGIIALASGMSDTVFSNYFKDAYNATGTQRGIIEGPRELPGLICMLIIGFGSFLGNKRLAIIAQACCVIGLVVLGVITPSFSIMLIFLFVFSLGAHIYMPLCDSIFMSLVKDKGAIGKRMGQYKSTDNAFRFIAGIVVFIGFRAGFFSFKTQIKSIFLVGAFFFFIALLLYIWLSKRDSKKIVREKKASFIFDKDYKYYYILAGVHGAQKQIMLVFGPWVLIEILYKGADTLALLTIAGSFLGIFFLRALGKWIDRFGMKNLLVVDALSFIFVYFFYGLVSWGLNTGTLASVGWPVFLAYGMFILDRMSMNMSMVRVLYLKSIVKKSEDITPTLSAGISLDHLITIIFALVAGFIWDRMGPQYVFFCTSALSFINLYIAKKIKVPKLNEIAK